MKQKRILAFMLSVAMLLSLMPIFTLTASADASFAGGDGTENNPYQIATADQFVSFRDSINNTYYRDKFIILTSNISLEGKTFSQEATNLQFYGTFDGNGYEISGLDITANDSYQGLFRKNNGTIKNLKVSGNINAYNKSEVGGIAGLNSGTIENCITDITVAADGNKNSYAGGITGDNTGTIKGCINLGSVTCNKFVGGIAGTNSGTISGCLNRGAVNCTGTSYAGGITGLNYGTAYDCRNEGTITGYNCEPIGGITGSNAGGTITLCSNSGAVGQLYDHSYRGGIAGQNTKTNKAAGKITQCYNSGKVSGHNEYVGGIVGYNDKSVVSDCYNTAVVEGTSDYIGGIAGWNENGTVSKCLNIGQVKGSYYVSGIVGCRYGKKGSCSNDCYYYYNDNYKDGYKTGNEIKDQNALKNRSAFSGWDFDSIWVMGDEYPLLRNNSEAKGTAAAPYMIWSYEELLTLANEVNSGDDKSGKYYILKRDIDMHSGGIGIDSGSGKVSWTPIGSTSDNSFCGTFDGNGHTVSNIYVNSAEAGLFGYIGKEDSTVGTVKNLSAAGEVIGKFVIGSSLYYAYAGGIARYNYGTIEGCTNYCTVKSEGHIVNDDYEYLGGIAATNEGTVKGCTNAGTVQGGDSIHNSKLGGIAGEIYGGAIENCLNEGDIKLGKNNQSNWAGGIVGYGGMTKHYLTSCLNVKEIDTTNKNATDKIGGIIAFCQYLNNGSTTGTACSGCYYLKASNYYGVGGKNEDYDAYKIYAKTAAELATGEIAWALQNGQTTQAWGQTLSGDEKDSYPVLTSDGDKKVNKITFMQKDGEGFKEYAVRYTNKKLAKADFPANLSTDENHDFWWSENKDSVKFDENTEITNDMTVYAVSGEITEASDKSDKIYLNKNKEIATPIDLNDYVKNKSGNEKNFAFNLQDENMLPPGLEFDESTGKITGTPTKVGTYTVKFNVANNGISLMSLESVNNVDVLTLTVDVDLEGTGTETNPFLINDLNELEYFSNRVNGGESYEGRYVKLMNDIDMTGVYGPDVNDTGKSWTPIGTQENPFKGTFDGNGKTISGLYILATDNNQGLFGVVTGGTVKDFTVKGNISVSATADKNVETIGAAVGLVYNGATVDGITSYVNISDEGMTANNINRHIGGIVGYLGKTKTDKASYIKNSCNYGNITMQSGQSVAGIVGLSIYNNEISNCFNYGNITFSGDASKHIGGIAGDANEGVNVKCCINYGDVTSGGADCIGGAVAYANASTKIENCANVGTVTCTNEDGGFIGGVLGYINNNGFGSLANCYNYGNIVSASGSANHPGAVVGWCRNTTNVSMFKNNYWRTGSCSAASNDKAIPDVYEKTDADFNSGEIAYLLQKNQTADIWGQNIGSDKYPTFSTAKVYEDEYNSEKIYRNAIDGNKIFSLGADKKSATVLLDKAGTYTIVFADYESNRLANIKTFEVTVDKAQAVRVISDEDFTLGTGDKIMLWDNFVNLTPMCEAYEVK